MFDLVVDIMPNFIYITYEEFSLSETYWAVKRNKLEMEIAYYFERNQRQRHQIVFQCVQNVMVFLHVCSEQ